MTQPDLSSLALPDSPELPAEIANILRRACSPFLEAKLRSVIAKHLLTAEEARFVSEAIQVPRVLHYEKDLDVQFALYKSADAKLRRLSGSSRGGGMREKTLTAYEARQVLAYIPRRYREAEDGEAFTIMTKLRAIAFGSDQQPDCEEDRATAWQEGYEAGRDYA